MDCLRSITFTIPGAFGEPDVQVTAVEADGTIEFTVEVMATEGGVIGDLRGLFFDFSDPVRIAGLVAEGEHVTDHATDRVIDLGHGANMRGKASPFDVGVEFGTPGQSKDDIQVASFTLSNEAGDLTLDDIAQVNFGARLTSIGVAGEDREGSSKITVVAPAAPDAIDDAYEIFEDGAAGLDDPSDTSQGIVFNVLDNDTDADGDTLTITSVHGVSHGTVEIIDGDDDDLLPGDALLYTPTTDYAGTDEFTYCITDNNGGTDFATVSVAIAAVADVPDVSIQAFATGNVNEIYLVVTATQTDDDSSEYISQIMSSSLPEGVTITPASVVHAPGENDAFQQGYMLTLQEDQDADFDLTFTATSVERSNLDTETGSATIDIVYDYNSETTSVRFDAEDQSIWSSGDAFEFIDDRFIGLDTGAFNDSVGSTFYAGVSGDIRVGFESRLEFNGGTIDATADYDVTVETNYNRTVDTLLIETGAVLTDAFFDTVGPTGSYTLDFVWDIFLQAYAGVNIDLGEVLGSINEQINFPALDIGPGSFNILDVDSETFGGSFTLPAPLDSLSVDYAWPNITTSSEPTPLDPSVSYGESNNFLQLNLDLDEMITRILGLPVNPLNPSIDLGIVYAELDLLNIYMTAGLNFLQQFEMDLGNLTGLIQFEDGSFDTFEIGESYQVEAASVIDAGGDGDGDVEFQFAVLPEAELENLTQLGFNIGGGVDVLSATIGYDIGVASDSTTTGYAAEFGFEYPVAAIDVFDDTFALGYDQEIITAYA